MLEREILPVKTLFNKMSNLKKKLLFIAAVIVFLTVSPLLVLFAQGNWLNFEDQDIFPTGGIYIKIKNTRANLFINGERKGHTSKFVSGLKPGIHRVSVKKEGYQDWEKQLCIRPYKVGLIKEVFLVPNEPKLVKNRPPGDSSNIENRYTAHGGGTKVSLRDLGSGFYLTNSKDSPVYNLYYSDHLNGKTGLVLSSVSNFKLSPDGRKAIFWRNNKSKIIWLEENLWLKKQKRQLDEFINAEPSSVVWHKDSFHIFYQKNSNLYWTEVDDRSGCGHANPQRNKSLLVEDIEDYHYDSSTGSLYVLRDKVWYEVNLEADLRG